MNFYSNRKRSKYSRLIVIFCLNAICLSVIYRYKDVVTDPFMYCILIGLTIVFFIELGLVIYRENSTKSGKAPDNETE